VGAHGLGREGIVTWEVLLIVFAKGHGPATPPLVNHAANGEKEISSGGEPVYAGSTKKKGMKVKECVGNLN